MASASGVSRRRGADRVAARRQRLQPPLPVPRAEVVAGDRRLVGQRMIASLLSQGRHNQVDAGRASPTWPSAPGALAAHLMLARPTRPCWSGALLDRLAPPGATCPAWPSGLDGSSSSGRRPVRHDLDQRQLHVCWCRHRRIISFLWLWVPESRSWVLSCRFATGIAGPR